LIGVDELEGYSSLTYDVDLQLGWARYSSASLDEFMDSLDRVRLDHVRLFNPDKARIASKNRRVAPGQDEQVGFLLDPADEIIPPQARGFD
jgi:hypothetical protein